MASSRVMASASSANSDLARQSDLYAVGRFMDLDGNRSLSGAGSASMDDMIRDFYAESSGDGGSIRVGGSERGMHLFKQESVSGGAGRGTAEEVWEEISRGRRGQIGDGRVQKEEFEEITLEDFLARAGAASENDSPSARAILQPQVAGPMLRFAADASAGDRSAQQNHRQSVDGCFPGFDHGASNELRGKRKIVADPVDRASQQKQKRMIKNRESAARSREKKQAYILQLETLSAALEEENATLLEEQAERRKARFKHLLGNLVPVVQRERPPPPRLRRTCSWQL